MENLNLKKLWAVCNTLSSRESELCEQNIFVHLLGHRSDYTKMSLRGFLEYYSFRVEGSSIVVFNDDGVPYESYTTSDFSYVPSVLLSFAEKDLEKWMDDEIEKQLGQQKKDKLAEKEDIKRKIKYLETQLNNL